YAALGRPRRAEPLLRAGLTAGARGRARPWALYAAWLATAYLDAGEIDEGCAVAGQALLGAIRTGSARAWRPLAGLEPRLRPVAPTGTRWSPPSARSSSCRPARSSTTT